MMRCIIAVVALIALCGCESEEEHQAKYMAFCTTHEFSKAQCEVMYLNFRQNERAEEAANASVGMSAAAMGMAAGRR